MDASVDRPCCFSLTSLLAHFARSSVAEERMVDMEVGIDGWEFSISLILLLAHFRVVVEDGLVDTNVWFDECFSFKQTNH